MVISPKPVETSTPCKGKTELIVGGRGGGESGGEGVGGGESGGEGGSPGGAEARPAETWGC